MHATLRFCAVAALGLALAAGAAWADKNRPDWKPDDDEVGNAEWRITEEWGYSRPEKTLREFHTGDLDECKRQCLREQSCRAYVYKTGSGSCRLKYEAVAKKQDRKSVTGVKVRRGGQDDRDDHGKWHEARQACRERVVREVDAGSSRVKLDFDEHSGETARFRWHAVNRQGSCAATEKGRVTEFRTFAGQTRDRVEPATKDVPAPATKDKKSKDK